MLAPLLVMLRLILRRLIFEMLPPLGHSMVKIALPQVTWGTESPFTQGANGHH